jgi:membrane protein DedA with SNARE-associated domain
LSFYSGLFFGPKLKNLEFLKKREAIFIRGEDFFNKYGWSGILIGRLIPAIRPFIPFIAGISSMKSIIFIISSILACVIWSLALAILILGIDNIINLF